MVSPLSNFSADFTAQLALKIKRGLLVNLGHNLEFLSHLVSQQILNPSFMEGTEYIDSFT
jgi:hypothetical protein